MACLRPPFLPRGAHGAPAKMGSGRRHSYVSSESLPHHFTTPVSECNIQIRKGSFLLLRFIKYAWLASKTRRGLKGLPGLL
ncbi:hypothetical protein CEXT_706401 [Caerostris extrusa]|uniref:Uncharacterized protein n=1 Tax=Caerostris extrusa TaxID=172846 RepID=A0AAV4Q9E7_CAEEX|nr:hypothetical protein CEXT_706401 [Caerostris extrusa]